jgi:hypothetical protein
MNSRYFVEVIISGVNLMSLLTLEEARLLLGYIVGSSGSVNITSCATGKRLREVLKQFPDFFAVIFSRPQSNT